MRLPQGVTTRLKLRGKHLKVYLTTQDIDGHLKAEQHLKAI